MFQKLTMLATVAAVFVFVSSVSVAAEATNPPYIYVVPIPKPADIRVLAGGTNGPVTVRVDAGRNTQISGAYTTNRGTIISGSLTVGPNPGGSAQVVFPITPRR